MKLTETQLEQIRAQIRRVKACGNPFYTERFKNVQPEDIKTQEDFEKLVPFCSKQDLRDAYPLGLATVPEEEIVRIHSSSGTTGSPVIIPYTKKDVEDWAIMFARCYEMAGITNKDRLHITQENSSENHRPLCHGGFSPEGAVFERPFRAFRSL